MSEPPTTNAAPDAPQRNRPRFEDLPIPDDTANLREGPDLHPDCLGLLPLVDIFLPNEPEALALAGAADASQAAAFLQDHCSGWVAVKLGERGLLARGPRQQQLSIAAPPVVAVDHDVAGPAGRRRVQLDVAAHPHTVASRVVRCGCSASRQPV